MVIKVSHNVASSRERLSRISHHFLSEDPSAAVGMTNREPSSIPGAIPDQNRQPYVLPVLMGSQDNHFPLYALSQALLAHKKSSAVLLVEGELASSPSTTLFNSKDGNSQDNTTSQGATKNPLFLHVLQHDPDVYLIPVASIKSSYVASYERVLIPIPASVIGIRAAYIQLKWLAVENPEIHIGITITQTPDPDWARRCFVKLATAAQKFLDLNIASYGYLPEMPQPELSPPSLIKHTRGRLLQEMIDVADLILLDLENHQREGAEKKQLEDAMTMTSRVGIP